MCIKYCDTCMHVEPKIKQCKSEKNFHSATYSLIYKALVAMHASRIKRKKNLVLRMSREDDRY